MLFGSLVLRKPFQSIVFYTMVLAAVLFCSCSQSGKQEARKNYDMDSLELKKMLDEALIDAASHTGQNKLHKKYEKITESGDSVEVDINLDHHFTESSPHLIIHRGTPNTIYIDIYARSGDRFEKVASREEWSMTYVSDTIRDINGDGLKDFVVNWYGSNGCCLKGFSNIYLLQQDNKHFSNDIEFINPTFSSAEKVIRGVCYGHPGETELYKYQWRGNKVDTVEYVSFEKNVEGKKTGKILISKNVPVLDGKDILKLLDTIPGEYTRIYGYDWFTGEGY